MLKLGFAVNSLAHSQLSYYLIREVNKFLGESNNADVDIILFYEEIDVPKQMPITATMHINEMWGFNGVLVTTTVNTTLKAIKVPGPKLKLFYPYTLEWIRPQTTIYNQFASAYLSDAFKIIARNEDHAQIIHNCFNRQIIGQVEDFNLKQLMEVISAEGIN